MKATPVIFDMRRRSLGVRSWPVYRPGMEYPICLFSEENPNQLVGSYVPMSPRESVGGFGGRSWAAMHCIRARGKSPAMGRAPGAPVVQLVWMVGR